jgi:DNA-binding transcriptional LysR family regulator
MPRGPLAVPTATMIAEAARAHYGVALAPERAAVLAGDVAKMLAAVDRAAAQLAFEDEPSGFLRALREAAR